MAIKLIVAVDANNGIGYENDLLFSIPEDLKRFKELTTGHFVAMGRKTYESLPMPSLPNRVNVVITRDKNYQPKDKTVIVETNIDKIINHYLGTGNQDRDIWIIGGSSLYREFIPYAEEIHITQILEKAENVDTYFPMELIEEFNFKICSYEGRCSKTGIKLMFKEYKRKVK